MRSVRTGAGAGPPGYNVVGLLVCPTCGRAVVYERLTDVPHRPFCCRRCQLVDLGKWFDEEYRFSGPLAGLGENDESAEAD